MITEVDLVDNIPGIGKSTAIGEMMKSSNERFVYITPFRTELDRFINDYPELNFKQPNKVGDSTLKDDFIRLIMSGENIVTTHATFKNITIGDSKLISEMNYTLVMDETIDAFEEMAISKQNCIAYEKLGWLVPDEDNILNWNFEEFPYEKVDDKQAKKLINLMQTSLVYKTSQGVFVSEFPYKVITCFNRVVVVTYLFEGTLLSHWVSVNGIKVNNITDTLTFKNKDEVVQAIKNNLEIYTASKFEGLSHSWYSKAKKVKPTDKGQKDDLQKIRTKITSFVKNNKIKAEDILITCPKDNWRHNTKEEGLSNSERKILERINKTNKPKLNGDRYSKATWAASNSRATNKYSDKSTIIYASNKYLCPVLEQHLMNRGSPMNAEKYALSEMVQFIWRGCIRNSKPMKVFVPSNRMYKILTDWVEAL